ncbi:MAG: M48 family metallopeptidase [Halobacteriota archaeon]
MLSNVNAYLVAQSKKGALSPHLTSLNLGSAISNQEPAAHERNVATICVGNTTIPYYVKRGRRNSKNVYLKLKMSLELVITIPPGMHVDVEDLLERKRGWIERHYQKLTRCKPIFGGNRILYKGTYFNVVTAVSPDAAHHNIAVQDDRIVIHHAAGIDPRIPLMNWMRAETIKYVVARTHELAKRFGIIFHDVHVKDMRAWGCCARNGDLFFTWQLIALPDELAEYVVLHELAHLSEFNHSKTFKMKLATLCPDYKERRGKLKEVILSSTATL